MLRGRIDPPSDSRRKTTASLPRRIAIHPAISKACSLPEPLAPSSASRCPGCTAIDSVRAQSRHRIRRLPIPVRRGLACVLDGYAR